jgi:hypothetical protein
MMQFLQCNLLQLCPDEESLRRHIVLNVQHIGPAADLAILDIVLPATSEIIDRRDIPLAAARALKT